MPKRPSAVEDLTPLLSRDEPRENLVSMRMRRSDIDALKALARTMNCGYSTVARLIVEKYLAAHNVKSRPGGK